MSQILCRTWKTRCLFLCLFVFLFVCSFVKLFVYLFVCTFVCLSVYFFVSSLKNVTVRRKRHLSTTSETSRRRVVQMIGFALTPEEQRRRGVVVVDDDQLLGRRWIIRWRIGRSADLRHSNGGKIRPRRSWNRSKHFQFERSEIIDRNITQKVNNFETEKLLFRLRFTKQNKKVKLIEIIKS